MVKVMAKCERKKPRYAGCGAPLGTFRQASYIECLRIFFLFHHPPVASLRLDLILAQDY